MSGRSFNQTAGEDHSSVHIFILINSLNVNLTSVDNLSSTHTLVCPVAHPSPPFAGDRRRRPRLSQFRRLRGKPTRHPRLPQASQSPWGKPNHCPRFTQVRLISSGLLVTPRCSCGSALPCLDLPCLESLKTVICSLRVPRSSLVCAP